MSPSELEARSGWCIDNAPMILARVKDLNERWIRRCEEKKTQLLEQYVTTRKIVVPAPESPLVGKIRVADKAIADAQARNTPKPVESWAPNWSMRRVMSDDLSWPETILLLSEAYGDGFTDRPLT